MRMKQNQMVQYFNDDGFSMLSNVSPGVYLITLLAITSWQVLSTLFNAEREAIKENSKWVIGRYVFKRFLQCVIVICWVVSLIKYSSISGLDAETWDNYDKQDGLKYEMEVYLYQSTNLASTLVCVFAFLLCVWSNVGNPKRWSKMGWEFTRTSTKIVPVSASVEYAMLPTQALSMNSMFGTKAGAAFAADEAQALVGGLRTGNILGSFSLNMDATSTNDTIVFYAFVLFFAFTQLIASRSSVCLETHLQCFIGVTLIFIVVELAYAKMSEFLWELEEAVPDTGVTDPKALRELMHVHYVAWVIRLFVCVFEIILFVVAREVFLADGDGFNGYFQVFFVLGMIYVAINLIVALMQALGIVLGLTKRCNDTLGCCIPMLWMQDTKGKPQRRQLRSLTVLFAPWFYLLVIVFTTFFCWDQVFGGPFGNNAVTSNERQLYASLTQQYLKANNYIDQPLEFQAVCRNSVPIERDATVTNCHSDKICGEKYLTNSTQMMLIQPAKDVTYAKRLEQALFRYNTWTKFIDPFHLKIGFWTKFFEIKKIDIVKDEQTKWTALNADKYGVLCHNFFALHEGVDCKAAAQYQRAKLM